MKFFFIPQDRCWSSVKIKKNSCNPLYIVLNTDLVYLANVPNKSLPKNPTFFDLAWKSQFFASKHFVILSWKTNFSRSKKKIPMFSQKYFLCSEKNYFLNKNNFLKPKNFLCLMIVISNVQPAFVFHFLVDFCIFYSHMVAFFLFFFRETLISFMSFFLVLLYHLDNM